MFNFFLQSPTHQRSAAQRLSCHSRGKIKNKRELVSLFDAEGPNVPFRVCFVLFRPCKNDFPFKPLVGKVEWNIKWRPRDKPAVKYVHSEAIEDVFISSTDWAMFHYCFTGFWAQLMELHHGHNLLNTTRLKMPNVERRRSKKLKP